MFGADRELVYQTSGREVREAEVQVVVTHIRTALAEASGGPEGDDARAD